MPSIYEYTLLMQDRVSGTMQKLAGTSVETINKLTSLQEKTDSLKRHTTDFGNSISALKQKIDILQSERELIDPENLTLIRQYNREIASLNRQITTLETTTGGSKLKTYAKDALSQIPGAGLLTNPLVMAGAGIAAVEKLSMSWDTGMAKINTTAQLSQENLDKLGTTIRKMGVDSGADLEKVPTAYEKILSQTNDVTLSTDILDKSLKGAKAGFTEIDVVSGALAQSLSAIGTGKSTAAEVMDTLFASKRVGAGEFADFANNIPGLIASGKNVGITWKEVSGAFAYMTGKGNDAATSTMLLQNAFTALGKSEITGGLKKAGVDVYDKTTGKMRSLVDIMTELSGLTASMNDQQKSDFLEAIGLKDAQAKQAFSVLTDETSKLQEAMKATANATGEMQAALDQANTPANKLKAIWSNITGTGLGLGDALEAIVNPALDTLLLVFQGIYWVVGAVGDVWDSWTGKLNTGSVWIWSAATAVGSLTVSLTAYNLWQKVVVLWQGIMTAASSTGVYAWYAYASAIAAVDAVWAASPIGVVIAILVAVGIAVYAAWQKFEGFRKIVLGVWEVMKVFGKILYDFTIGRITDLVKGIGSIGQALYKLFTGDFKGAWESAKEGMADMSGISTASRIYEEGKKIGEAWEKGKAAGAVSWKNSQYEKTDNGFRFYQQSDENKSQKSGSVIPNTDLKSLIFGSQDKITPVVGSEKTSNNKPEKTVEEIMAAVNSGKKVKGKQDQKDDSLSLGLPQDYNQTNTYAEITAKLGGKAPQATDQKQTETPVKSIASRVDEINGSLKKIAASVAIPVALTVGAANVAQASVVPDDVSGIVANVSNPSETIETSGKCIYLERFCDKIEIHVNGQDAPKQAADQVRAEVEKALAEIFNV